MEYNLQSIFGSVFEERSRTIYARITPLDFKTELPSESGSVEGQITSGSINIDGSSAVRRTCSLTIVTVPEADINEIDWALKNKFKVEIGIENDQVPLIDLSVIPETEINDFNSMYYIENNILWINQGLYVITSFSLNKTINNMTIQIQGRDKMCYLNGDVGGVFTSQIDLAKYDQLDDNGNIIATRDLTIAEIIKNLLCRYSQEKEENLVLDEEVTSQSGKNLLEYRGNDTLYFLGVNKTNEENNITYFQPEALTTFGGQKVKKMDGTETKLEKLSNNSEITIGENNTKILQKYEYGQNVGYEMVDLIYPGELLANVGETITSILDKLINLFVSFEYFYDVNGKFHFQKKSVYMNTSENQETGELEMQSILPENYIWDFADSEELFVSDGTAPAINNLKNDYSVWGTFSGLSGEIPIHYRLAIENKPTYYKSAFRTKDDQPLEFSSDNYDWRELIYQMAVDYSKFRDDIDFYTRLEAANMIDDTTSYYPEGVTSYEDFYIDMLAFWRDLYNPEGKILDQPTTGDDPEHSGELYMYKRQHETDKKLSEENIPIENILIQDDGKQYTWLDYVNLKDNEILIEDTKLQPYYIDIDGIQTNLEEKIDLTKNAAYYLFPGATEYYQRLYLNDEFTGDSYWDKDNSKHLYYDEMVFFKNIDGRRASQPKPAVDIYDIETNIEDIPGLTISNINNIASITTGYLYEKLYVDIIDNNTENRILLPLIKLEDSSGNILISSDTKININNIKDIQKKINGARINDQYYYGQNCRLKYKVVTLREDNELEYMPDGNDENGNIKYIPLGDYLAKEIKTNYFNYQKRNLYFKVSENKYVNCLSTINFQKQNVYQLNDNKNKIYLVNKAKEGRYTYDIITDELIEAGEETPLTEIVYMRDWMGNEIGQYAKPIQYFYKQALFNTSTEEDKKDYWVSNKEENSYKQAFWIDFIGEDDENLIKYSRREIGRRTKAINDSAARRLLKIQIPQAIFGKEEGQLNLPDQYRDYFVLSSVGKSVQDSVDELLYQHLYCTETKTLSCIPIYGLEPNQLVRIKDEEDDYIINKISIPLAYNGMMGLTLTKAPPKKIVETEVVESV